MNEKTWDNPFEFKPERFESNSHYPTFSPFSTGPRNCIGQSFAKTEMRVVLPTLMRNFDFKLKPDFIIEEVWYVTLRPKNGLLMSISPIID